MLLEERPARAQMAARVGSESPLSCITAVVALISSFLRIDSIPSFGISVPDNSALAFSERDRAKSALAIRVSVQSPDFVMRAFLDQTLGPRKLDIEHQHLALGSRDARQHPVASTFLLGAEKDVAMVRNAFQNARQAGSAHALSARRFNANAVLREHLGNRLPLRHRVNTSAAGQSDLKRSVRPGWDRRAGGKVF